MRRVVNRDRMKLAALLIAGVTTITLADDFRTLRGKEYKNATVMRVEPDGIVVRTKSGISKVYFVELPEDVQQRFHYVDPAKVEAERAAKTAALQRAKADERAQQRADKDQKARAILTKTGEEFEAAESRAAQGYRKSWKGSLSGQVFVATKGGENVKLGARQVSLFDRDALAILAAGVKAFADVKREQLQLDIAAAEEDEKHAEANAEQARAEEESAKARGAEAKAAERRAESDRRSLERGPRSSDTITVQNAAVAAANQAGELAEAAKRDLDAAREARNGATEAADAARARIESLRAEQAYYYSEEFLFSQLRHPIQTVDTDAEGKFAIQMPKTGAYVITAQTQRLIWNDTERRRTLPRHTDISGAGATENYYWLQVVSLEGQDERVQNLSNTNLGGTRGISSLIPLTR